MGQKFKALLLKTGVTQEFPLFTCIENATWSLSHSKRARARNKKDPNRKRRIQIILLCRCHDPKGSIMINRAK